MLLNAAAALLLFNALVSGQDTATNAPAKITAAQAKQHINSEAVVVGKVVEVNKAEKLVRLNFEKPFPNQPFTAVIFSNKTNLFPEIEKAKNKTVEVKGMIAEYRGRPEIIITRTNQLRILETPAPGSEK